MSIQLLAKDRMFKNKDYPTPFSAMVIYGFVFITCLQILGILKKEKSIILVKYTHPTLEFLYFVDFRPHLTTYSTNQ